MVNKRKKDRRLRKSLKKRKEECRELRNARAFRNYFVKTGYLPENPDFFNQNDTRAYRKGAI